MIWKIWKSHYQKKKGDTYIVFGRKVFNLILMLAWGHLVRGIRFSPIIAGASESACQNVCVVAICILTATKSMPELSRSSANIFWLCAWLTNLLTVATFLNEQVPKGELYPGKNQSIYVYFSLSATSNDEKDIFPTTR